jgi:hypothetical protein
VKNKLESKTGINPRKERDCGDPKTRNAKS